MRRILLLLVPVIAIASLSAVGHGDEPEKVIRLGIIGMDTSHLIAFTSHLNNPKNHTACRVVAGFPGGSPDFKASADRVDSQSQFTLGPWLEMDAQREEFVGTTDTVSQANQLLRRSYRQPFVVPEQV
jgi:hypothetical protein